VCYKEDTEILVISPSVDSSRNSWLCYCIRFVDNIYNPLAVFEFKEMVYIAVCGKEKKIRLVVIGVSLIVENSIKEI
jgi:hypothetical protein